MSRRGHLLAESDQLLGGGLPFGSSTLLVGPAGTGKSSLGLSFCVAADHGPGKPGDPA